MLCMAGFLTFFTLSLLCVCMCVSVNKISQKILNESTSILAEAFPVTQEGKQSILKKKSPGARVGVFGGGGGFGPNDKRQNILFFE